MAAVQFLPIGIGLLLQQAAPRASQKLRQPLRRLVDGAFLALAALLLIARLGGASERITPTILGYALVSLLIAAPFSIWSKGRSAAAIS